jgi:hypothetical protein
LTWRPLRLRPQNKNRNAAKLTIINNNNDNNEGGIKCPPAINLSDVSDGEKHGQLDVGWSMDNVHVSSQVAISNLPFTSDFSI